MVKRRATYRVSSGEGLGAIPLPITAHVGVLTTTELGALPRVIARLQRSDASVTPQVSLLMAR